jgi:predicted ATPase
MLADVEPRVSSPVLVGRSSQLSTLDTALAGAGRGQPSAVLVGGEAGVGKSRLVSEFAERSRSTGARVLAGGCLELGADGLPFAPFTSVLRELGVTSRGEAAATAHRLRLFDSFSPEDPTEP